MKFVRFIVLLAMTGAVPGLVLQSVGQQEIDPEHFDQAELAKTAHSAKQPKGSPRATALKSQHKSIGKATNVSRITPRPRQVKAENQRIDAVRSTGE
jgi:hypothetical protein